MYHPKFQQLFPTLKKIIMHHLYPQPLYLINDSSYIKHKSKSSRRLKKKKEKRKKENRLLGLGCSPFSKELCYLKLKFFGLHTDSLLSIIKSDIGLKSSGVYTSFNGR